MLFFQYHLGLLESIAQQTQKKLKLSKKYFQMYSRLRISVQKVNTYYEYNKLLLV